MKSLHFPLLAAVLLISVGCAKRGWVKYEVAAVHERIDDVESQVESTQTRLDRQDDKIVQVSDDLASASRTAREALQRAIEAGKLAEGKLLYETVLSNDKVRFDFDQTGLGKEAAMVLDAFAGTIKGYDTQVFIEIQGHTCSVGADRYNLTLGESRAESVRRYLNGAHGLPLHRMSVISYGESEPVADNTTHEGRMRNRRVNLVVLQ